MSAGISRSKNMNRLIHDLLEINRRLSFELWHITPLDERASGLSPRMLLPTKPNGEVRIGEYEPMKRFIGFVGI